MVRVHLQSNSAGELSYHYTGYNRNEKPAPDSSGRKKR